MGGLAVESELGGLIGQPLLIDDGILIAGMPGKNGIDITEDSGAHEEDFAGAALFGGCSIESDGAGDLAFDHPVLKGDGGKGAARGTERENQGDKSICGLH